MNREFHIPFYPFLTLDLSFSIPRIASRQAARCGARAEYDASRAGNAQPGTQSTFTNPKSAAGARPGAGPTQCGPMR